MVFTNSDVDRMVDAIDSVLTEVEQCDAAAEVLALEEQCKLNKVAVTKRKNENDELSLKKRKMQESPIRTE